MIDGRYEAILCSNDAQALGVSFGRDKLSAKVPYPSHDVVTRAFDKLELCQAARRAGMGAPETTLADEQAIARVDLPVLVKSRLHWTPGAQRAPARLEAMICSDRESIHRRVAEIRANGGDAVLQEIIHCARLLNYVVVVDRAGEIVAGVQSIADPLVYPGPDVGVRVRSHTVPLDEELHRNATALMNELGWVGFTSLQMLLPSDGEAKVIDFNGRFTNAIDQYIAAGPNFPDLWARVVTGRPLPPISPVSTGVRFQWLEGDLRRAFVQRRGGLFNDVFDCLSYARGAVHTTWRREDPAPAALLAMRLSREASVKVGPTLRRAARNHRRAAKG